MNNYTKTLKAFLTGVAIGSIAAMVLTPYSGKKMRRIVKEKGKGALDEVKDRYEDFEDSTLKPGLDKIAARKEKLSSAIHDAGTKFSSRVKRFGDRVEDEADSIADDLK